MKLKMFEVVTADDFEAMRIVRNSCVTYLTGSTKQMSADEQTLWSQTLDRTLVHPFVFEKMVPSRLDGNTQYHAVVGYGLARRLPRMTEAGTWWLSGGLLPMYRGAGGGKNLFGQLADYVNGLRHVAWLDVRADNQPAIRTYQALGFTQVDGHIFHLLDGQPVKAYQFYRRPS